MSAARDCRSTVSALDSIREADDLLATACGLTAEEGVLIMIGEARASLADAEAQMVVRPAIGLLPRNDAPECQRVQRLTAKVLGRNPRVDVEFLDELARAHGIADDILRRLRRWSRLTTEMLRVAGGDRLVPTPLHQVPSDQ